MNRIGRPDAWLVIGLLAAAVVAGCHKSTTPSGTSAAAGAAGKLGPEESFKVILATFKRGTEDVQAGFVLPESAGSGHSMLATQNKVTSELLPPANESEPYRATITVTNRSRFSLQRSDADDAKDRKDEKNQQDANSGSSADITGADNGVQILDPDLVSSSSAGGKGKHGTPISDTAVARQTVESQRTYELVYQNGRWSLVTKLDPDLEKSIQGAFDQALGTQP